MSWIRENKDGLNIMFVFVVIFLLAWFGVLDWIFDYIITPILSGFFTPSDSWSPGETYPY